MRRTLAFVLTVVLALSSLAAADLSFKAAAGQITGAALDISSKHDTDVDFNFDIDAEVDMVIAAGQGMMLGVHPYMSENDFDFALQLGYLYTMALNDRVDLLVTAGPEFLFTGSDVEFSLFCMVDFDIFFTSSLFLRVGTGLDFSFGPLNSDFGDEVEAIIPMPALGLGWRF